jgi:hypothetical protein
MQLVVMHSYGDGCTYHTVETRAVEYSSAEEFLAGLEAAWKKCKRAESWQFMFAGKEWSRHALTRDCAPFTFEPPRVLTVEEWFQESLNNIHG